MVAAHGSRSDEVADRCVAALDRIGRAIRTHRQNVATEAGLSPLQAELLRTLDEGPPPRPLTSHLARELGVRQPTVSDSLEALERKGLLVREPDSRDGRRSRVVLTATGGDLAGRLGGADEAIRAAVARLSEQAQADTLARLLGIIEALVAEGVVQVSRTCFTCVFFDTSGEVPACRLIGAELRPGDLRVNCPEHSERRGLTGSHVRGEQ